MTASYARVAWLAGGAAFAVCIGFAAWTGHAWEDYYITFRASLNLATGHGLVFQPGERTHSFTSPLGTLLPALFALGGGENAPIRALWGLRIVSALALGAALWLAARMLARTSVVPFAAIVGCALIVLDPKIVDFAINGMESALLIFWVVATWRALHDGARMWSVAAGFAGLQWTRPDGVVFFAVLAVAWWTLGPQEIRWRRGGIMAVLRGAALGLILYLPWVAFAWAYYGSPVPHTIQAKISHHAPGELAVALWSYPWRLLFGRTGIHGVFAPTYVFFGGWPDALEWLSRGLAVGAALGWLLPGMRAGGRMASGAFFLGGMYVEYIPRSPWYYPAWEALGFLVWAYAIDAGWQRVGLRPAIRVLASVLVALQLMLLIAVGWQMKVQQALIETGQRTVIGRWLREHARPHDRVYLEPLGYIGFYSALKMLDYPGLCAPEVVTARRAGHSAHAPLITALQPDWLVLRPDQVATVQTQDPAMLLRHYELARVFDVRSEVEAVRWLPGRGYLEFDAVYFVFVRRSTER